MSDMRLGINIITQADQRQVELLTARIRDLQAALRQLQSYSTFDATGAGVRNLVGQLENAEGQLRRLYEIMRQPPAAFASLPENAWPIQYAKIVAGAKKETDELTRAQSQLTQRLAPQVNIAGYRREVEETARAEEKLTAAQEKFASRVAPQVNIAAHRREEAQRLREVTASLERYNAELAKEGLLRGRFASQIAPQTPIRFVQGAEGLEAVPRNFRNIRNEADNAALATRRFITGFDEISRGQRGQLISTIGASLKDMGISATGAAAAFGGFLAVVGVERLVRGAEAMGRWAEQTRAASAAIGTSVEAYSRLQGALVLTGAKAESADSSLRIFARNISEAVGDPASRAAQAFRAIGISEDELKQHSNDALAVFALVADQFQKLSANQANAVNLAGASAELFGRSIENMARLLPRGSAAFKELGDIAAKTGVTLDENTADAMAKTGEQARTLGATISGNATKAFEAWEPEIQDTIGLLQKLVDVLGTATAGVGNFVNAANRAQQAATQTAAAAGYIVDVNTGMLEAVPGGATPMPSGTSPREGRRFGAIPGVATAPSVPALGSQVSAYQQLQEKLAEADDAATAKGGSAAQMRMNALKAQIDVLKGALNDPGLNPQQITHIKAEIARDDAQLNEKVASQGASAAKQAYEAFAAEERNKLELARGNAAEQAQILQEWGARAASEGAKAIAAVQAARIRVQQEQTSAAVANVHAAMGDAELQIRAFEEEMQQRVKTRDPAMHVSQTQAYGFDIQEISRQYDSLREKAASLAATPNLTAQQQQGTQQLQTHLQLAEETAVATYQEKMIAASEKIGAALQKNLASAFDRLGDSFERYITEALTRSTSGQQAGRQLVQGLVGSGVSMVGSIASQTAAQFVPGAKEGQGLGAALAQFVVTQITHTALFTSMLTALGIISANTAATAAAGTTTAAAATATAVKPEVLGTSYSMGGLVPSAAGGMIVPGTRGGQLSILHSQEMVLPANISNHILNSMQGSNRGGDMHFTYAPTAQGGTPFQSRGAAEQFFNRHGDLMMQMAQGLRRNHMSF